jgi:hypothetical protein
LKDPKLGRILVGLRMRTVFCIETPSLVLRPLVLADTQRMLEMSQEDCARQWLPSQIYRDERHAGTAIEYLIGQFNLDASPTTNALVFGVEEKVTGRLIGHVGLSPLFDTVEVGFGIATSEQRKGYATEGVARVCAGGVGTILTPRYRGSDRRGERGFAASADPLRVQSKRGEDDALTRRGSASSRL